MPIFAIVKDNVVENIVVADTADVFDHHVAACKAIGQDVRVIRLIPNPHTGWTYDPTTKTFTPPADQPIP